MKPSTLKQNYKLARLLGIQVCQVMLACLSSATAWNLISKIENARKNNNTNVIHGIKSAIIYGSF